MDDKINDLIALLGICHANTNLFLLSEIETLTLLQDMVTYEVTLDMVKEVLSRIELYNYVGEPVEVEEDFYNGY
jgi:hypothetical protein